MAAGLLDEAEHLAEAKSGPMPGRLGREEGLKNLTDNVGRNSCTRVGDRNRRILAGRHIRIRLRIGIIKMRVRRLDRQATAIRHGVTRIQRQINDGAFELMRVDVCGP